jgi:hypothetical protein
MDTKNKFYLPKYNPGDILRKVVGSSDNNTIKILSVSFEKGIYSYNYIILERLLRVTNECVYVDLMYQITEITKFKKLIESL